MVYDFQESVHFDEHLEMHRVGVPMCGLYLFKSCADAPRIQKGNLLAGCQVASIASSGVVIFTNLGPFGFTFCAFPMAEPSVFWESHVSLTCLWARSGAARVPC